MGSYMQESTRILTVEILFQPLFNISNKEAIMWYHAAVYWETCDPEGPHSGEYQNFKRISMPGPVHQWCPVVM